MCILPLSDQAENTNLIQNKKTQKTDETYFAASYLKNVFLKHFYREKRLLNSIKFFVVMMELFA